MPYITHAQLADRPGARELAEVASPPHEPMVPYALMDAALAGEDTSAWSAGEIARCGVAIERIDSAVAAAQARIDGYLAVRGYLPLDPVPTIVVEWTRAMARYVLHQDRIADDSDPVLRGYREAIRLLEELAAGRFHLGIAPAAPAAQVTYRPGSRPIRDAMRDY